MSGFKVAMISGARGQDGILLSRYLLDLGYKVVGLSRSKYRHQVSASSDFVIEETNYTQNSITQLLKKHSPDEFYNLAGQTFVGKSWLLLDETFTASGLIPIYILESILEGSKKIKFFQASSSEIYKPSSEALTEKSSIGPINPYGCAKAFSHSMVDSYRNNYGLFAVNGVLFNHESEYRQECFLSKKVISGAFDIKFGKKKQLLLGNLCVRRDWGYAGDYVKAMHASLQVEISSNYNICSGKAYSVEELVAYVFNSLDLNYSDYVESNKDLVRNNEQDMVLGSFEKAEREINWKPEISFQETLRIMMEAEAKKRGCHV